MTHFSCLTAVIMRSARAPVLRLLVVVMSGALLSCGLPPGPGGEGAPPGYIGGGIPAEYAGRRNPYSPDDELALQAGSTLYIGGCLVCHGTAGRGDGPKWPHLEPTPPDFASPWVLRAFRERQDYVFWWVSDGVRQTSMMAFGDTYSETERWQVITYAWHLGEQAAKGRQ